MKTTIPMAQFDGREKENTKEDLPIRVGQVVYKLDIGGSEMLAWRIAQALNSGRRHTCSIYAIHGSGTLAEVLAAEGISAKAFSRNGRIDVKLILRLVKQFRAQKIQVLHTHHLGQLLYGGIAGRLVGARVVHTEHEHYTISPLHLRRLLRILSVLTYAVTAVAEPVTEFLRKEVGIPVQKLRTIPNGVNVTCFSAAKPVNRGVLGWRETDVVIGCIARLEPEKGHALLLEAFKRVHARHPEAKLLLIGNGTERGRLEQISLQFDLKGSVLFAGTRTEVPELLATCDIVALASVHEGLPISILEAMAAGKPIVATRVGSVPQVVLEGETGLLVDPSDVGALAKALETLIVDKMKRLCLGSRAFDLALAHHSFDRTLSQYTALYNAAAARRGQ